MINMITSLAVKWLFSTLQSVFFTRGYRNWIPISSHYEVTMNLLFTTGFHLIQLLVGGLEHFFFNDFPYIGNNKPIWRTHIFQRRGEKPPTRLNILNHHHHHHHNIYICICIYPARKSHFKSAFFTFYIPGHHFTACLPKAWREKTAAHGTCDPTHWSSGATAVLEVARNIHGM